MDNNLNNNEPNFVMGDDSTKNNINDNNVGFYDNNNFTNDEFQFDNEPLNEKKPKKNRKWMKYVGVGLVGAILGGIITTSSILYVLPKSDMFKNTELYKSIKGNSVYEGKVPEFTQTSEGMSLTDVVKQVAPAVVGVSTKSVSQDMFYGKQQVMEGIGSGVIFSEEGYVLTNYHVIQGAQEVKVILNDNGEGKEVNAKVVNYDAQRDIAIVKITDDIKMPAVAPLGDSDELLPGQQVVAIGNPLGKEFLGTVTSGIISAVNRDIVMDQNGTKLKFIQTDTAINKGNSGGPLINAKGEVIGINTLKTGETGVEGMGFAIPINEIKPKLEDLLKPLLKIGIAGKPIDENTAKENNVPQGVLVAQVEDLSSAQKAGLQAGDIITSFDGKVVKTVEEINEIKTKHKSGDTVKVEIYRNNSKKTIELQLAE